MLAALWRYRNFVISAIVGEFRSKYARSRLGLAWSILHPLGQVAVFSIVFAEVLTARLGSGDFRGAYPIYLMSGLAAWGLFSEIVNRCLTVFIDYGSVLKKIAFPRVSLLFIVWGSALINHLLLLATIMVAVFFLGSSLSLTWVALCLGVLLISLFAFGLGLTLGILNVFSRDLAQAMSVVMQLWFWLTPIVYSYETLPASVHMLIDLNPMTAMVRIYQDAIFFNEWPAPHSLIFPGALSLGLFGISLVIFRRASSELVDAL